MVERVVAEKSWWHKNCFRFENCLFYYCYIVTFVRCKECNKTLTLDTYASHQGVIYCKPHQRDLFKPKAVTTDLSNMSVKQNVDFANYKPDDPSMADRNKKHERERRGLEAIVRESQPTEQLAGVIKGKVSRMITLCP